ncbi:MAG TPA: response regulator [Candidatus Limnocylindrales bacterium]|nr:response regulator [Candidatus Limnocylindrales bacterium]
MQDPEAESPPRDPARDPAAADVAHELGNRLAAIVAFSHLIRTDPRLPADLHDQADLLVEEAGRTRQLVERLLESAGPRPEAHAATVPPPAGPAAPFRVLVVDDEPAIRDFLARILRRLGYDPVVAADGDAALAIVRSGEPPHAILCDHRMAGMTGPAFHHAVREQSPELAARFAFMSGDVTNPTLRDLAAERGVVLLAKPFDMEQVARTVGDLVEG